MAGKKQHGRVTGGTAPLLVLTLLWVSVGADVWYGQLTITKLVGSSTENCDNVGCGNGIGVVLVGCTDKAYPQPISSRC